MVTKEDVLQALDGIDISAPIAGLEAGVPLTHQGLDSLDLATLKLTLESKYNKAISPETFGRLRTINDIVAFLNR